MLAGSPFVVLPKTVMLSEMLKGVVPIGVRDFIADHVIGVYHTMEDFVGRSDKGDGGKGSAKGSGKGSGKGGARKVAARKDA